MRADRPRTSSRQLTSASTRAAPMGQRAFRELLGPKISMSSQIGNTAAKTAIPPPRGVGVAWLERSFGWSRMARAHKCASTTRVPTALMAKLASVAATAQPQFMACFITSCGGICSAFLRASCNPEPGMTMKAGACGARMPRVSYVVTIYNKAAYLPYLIEGLANQEGEFEREHIFVNDGSTDDSLAVLRGLAAAWPRVKIIDLPNGGPSLAMNAGLRAASGDFIKPVDDDNMLV